MPSRPGLHSLELKLPPVALVLIIAVLMWLGAAYGPQIAFPFQSLVAAGFAILGLVACTLGFVEFKRAKTTLNPTKPQSSSALVTSGIYRHSRNPMYLGFLLILAGWAIFVASVLALFGLPTFVLYMNRFQIEPEERALASIFGDEFKAYCSTVRRWI